VPGPTGGRRGLLVNGRTGTPTGGGGGSRWQRATAVRGRRSTAAASRPWSTSRSALGLFVSERHHRPVRTPTTVTATEASAPNRAAHRRRCRVLVVDDQVELGPTLSRVLSRFGYDVVTADSGHAALQLVQQSPVDLVVTDVDMPTMTGTELADEVWRRFPRMPVLFVTGSGADLGAVGNPLAARLAKPVRLEELRDSVSQLVERATDLSAPGQGNSMNTGSAESRFLQSGAGDMCATVPRRCRSTTA